MEFTYTSSPHVRSKNTTRRVMFTVVIALLPTAIMGVIYFGLQGAAVLAVATLAAFLSEFLYRLALKEPAKKILATFDGSSLVTGLILGLILPPTWHLYIPALGSAFAVVAVKMLFGGTGNNLVNPAATGRIFLFISFTTILNNTIVQPSIGAIYDVALTGATSLQTFLAGGQPMNSLDLLLGTGVAGSIGETCKVAILLGGLFLVQQKIVKFWQPLLAIASAGLTAVLLNGSFSAFLPTVLSGGFLFAAVFMATDYVTNAGTDLGNVIYFAAFGILTSLLRHFTGFETASFTLLLLNVLVPLIDKVTLHKPFGYKKPKKEADK